jgi:hypothetical protein
MKKKGVLLPSSPRYVSEMVFGIVGVVEVDVVAKELAAHWVVAEFVVHQRLRK